MLQDNLVPSNPPDNNQPPVNPTNPNPTSTTVEVQPTNPNPTQPSQPTQPQPTPSQQPPQPVQTTQQLEEIGKKLETSITETVSKSIITKIGEALGLSKKDEEKLPTDPKELAALIKAKTDEALDARARQEDDQRQKEEEDKQRQLDDGAKAYQTLWTTQYGQLAEANKVPKITDANNKDDPGVVAKTKLLTKLAEVINYNQANGINIVPTLKEIFYDYPEVLRGGTPAGATVPVSGDGRTHGNPAEYTWKDIHASSFEDIMRNGNG